MEPREHEAAEVALDARGQADHAADAVVGVELDEAVARGLRVGPHDHRRDGAALAMERDDVLQAELEEAVAVHHHERLAGEQRLGALDAAAGVEDRILPRVLHLEPEAAAVADAFLDPLPEVMEVDDDLADAAGAQELEDVLDERPPRDR